MLEGYYLRRPTNDDLNGVLGLMIACDMRDVGFPDSDLDELRADWERIDLERDAWLVLDKQHRLQGYGAILPWSNGKLLSVYDAPGSEDADIFLALSILCEGRARQMLTVESDVGRKIIAHYISDSAEYQKKILQASGYSLTKFLFNMRRDLDSNEPLPEWPDGYQLRTVDPPSDALQLHALIQDAFDHPGHIRQPFEDWKDWLMRPPLFIPDLWFLLEYQGEIVACALCFEYENMGWVRQLAVREDHRGRGLGKKLLQQAFFIFKQRGFSKVGLAVEAENATAFSLYQSAGMQKTVLLDEFSKKLAF